jgi:hypothetical protein
MMKRTSISIIFLFALISVAAQGNLFDADNSRRFAHYLYNSGDFKQAAAEFERVVFLAPEDSVSRYFLVASYRQSAQSPDIGLRRFQELFAGDASHQADLRREVALLYASGGNYAGMQQFLEKTPVFTTSDSLLLISSFIFQEKYSEALLFSEHNQQSDLHSLVIRSSSLPYKDPNLAVAMSVIIPGSGKIYAGQWKDGLFSLLFTGMSAWQSYRAFHKEGIKSAYGWFYGGVSLGFYLGNLYGSYKAVSKHNNQLQHEINHELDGYLRKLD